MSTVRAGLGLNHDRVNGGVGMVTTGHCSHGVLGERVTGRCGGGNEPTGGDNSRMTPTGRAKAVLVEV